MSKTQTFEEVSKNWLTVGKLKKLLSKYPDDMFVGKVGHFGEFHDMNETDFNVSHSYFRFKSWVHNATGDIPLPNVLDIYTPDIGPEPD